MSTYLIEPGGLGGLRSGEYGVPSTMRHMGDAVSIRGVPLTLSRAKHISQFLFKVHIKPDERDEGG